MFFNQLSCKTMKFKWSNSLEIEFCFFESQIWHAWLELHKNWMFIMEDKNANFILYYVKFFWMAELDFCIIASGYSTVEWAGWNC